MRYKLPAALGLILATALPAAAQERPEPREAPPAAFARAVQCRTIADPGERLACYDREVAALATAEEAREIRVVDRQSVQRTRRTLFGLTLPDLNIFGGDEDEVSEINSTIQGLTALPYGKYAFVLADGARWTQIDTRNLRNEPRVGQTIRIRRAALGSFMANVNGERAIRVRRVQ